MSAASQPGKVAPKFRRKKDPWDITWPRLMKMKSNATSQEFCFSKISPNDFLGFDKGGTLNFTSFDLILSLMWKWGGILWNTLEARRVQSQRARLSGPLSFYSHLVPCIILGFLLQILASYPFVGRGVVHCLKFKWWLIEIVQWIRLF